MFESLDAAYDFITSTGRARSPSEAHWRLNQAYLELTFAWAYSRDAATEARSEELLSRARAALPAFDPVHQLVLKGYELRIREHGVSPWRPLPIQLESLSKFEQYKVIRLLEQSAILSRVETLDALKGSWEGAYVSRDDAITDALVADGEGRHDDARAALETVFGFLESETHLTGASLRGPSLRVGCEPRLREILRARFAQTPSVTLAAALISLGEQDMGLPRIEALLPTGPQRLWGACQLIGALALAGRTAEAEPLAARTWREATDSFSTNSHFSLGPLRVCETVVLSVLRHELALGNKFTLESSTRPAQRAREPEAALPSRQATADVTKETFLRALLSIREALDAAAEHMVGPSRAQLVRPRIELVSLLSKNPAQAKPPDLQTEIDPRLRPPSKLEEVNATIRVAHNQLSAARGSWGAQFLNDARRVLTDVAQAVARVDREERQVRAWLLRFFKAVATIDTCLRSATVEQPWLPEPIHRRIAELHEHHSPPIEATQRYGINSAFVQGRGWREAPIAELLRIADLRLFEARRRLKTPPEGWEPLLEDSKLFLETASEIAAAIRHELAADRPGPAPPTGASGVF